MLTQQEKKTLVVNLVGKDPVTEFAADELIRYLEKATNRKWNIEKSAQCNKQALNVVFPGRLSSLPIKCDSLKDKIFVGFFKDRFILTGSNPRSVLFSVYTYLEYLGLRWIFPGPEGEIIPQFNYPKMKDISIQGNASYHHRGICIEGAPSVEHTLHLIDWMAKKKMNEFFLQFKNSSIFWKRYYSRDYNPFFGKRKDISEENVETFDKMVIFELKKRGMILGRVGHGWTAEALGFKGLGWDKSPEVPTDDKRELLAQIDGKREFFKGVALNTELCYSNEKAFKVLTGHVVNYAQTHPEVDILHFWLSDAINNHCECKNCRKLSPSDWYAKLINEIASQLHKVAPRTKLVFLAHLNTYWPPEKVKIENKYNNLIFMFAPMRRCYWHSLNDSRCDSAEDLPRPQRNHVSNPRRNTSFVKLLKMWERCAPKDSFLFDYHLWQGPRTGALHGNLTHILYQDTRDLSSLDGFLSCQTLRAFFPTGLEMTTMAEVLWNKNLSFEDISLRYFVNAFDDGKELVKSYFFKLLEFITPPEEEKHKHLDPVSYLFKCPEKASQVINHIETNVTEIERMQYQVKEFAQRKCYEVLLDHATYLKMLSESSLYFAKNKREEALQILRATKDFLLKRESQLEEFVDMWLLSEFLDRWIKYVAR